MPKRVIRWILSKICITKIVPITEPEPTLEPLSITKLNRMRDVYTKIITDIQSGKINYLTSSILDDIYINKAYIKGLINELYITHCEDMSYRYTKAFDRLDLMLSLVVRRQFYKGQLRISKSIIIRRDVHDMLSSKSKEYFSADF